MKRLTSVVLLNCYFLFAWVGWSKARKFCLTKFAEKWICLAGGYRFGLMSHGTGSSRHIKTLWMTGPRGLMYAHNEEAERLILWRLVLYSEFPYKIFLSVF